MEFDRFRWFFVVLFCLFEWILTDFGWAATSEVGVRFFFGCVHLDYLFWESIGQPHALKVLNMIEDHMPD